MSRSRTSTPGIGEADGGDEPDVPGAHHAERVRALAHGRSSCVPHGEQYGSRLPPLRDRRSGRELWRRAAAGFDSSERPRARPPRSPMPHATCITTKVAGIRSADLRAARRLPPAVRRQGTPRRTGAAPARARRRPRPVSDHRGLTGRPATSAGATRWYGRITPGLARATRTFASSVPEVLAAKQLQPVANVVASADLRAEDDAAAGRPDALVELVVLVRWIRLVEQTHPLEGAAPEGAEEDCGHLLLVPAVPESGPTHAEWRAHGSCDRPSGRAVADRLLEAADVVGARVGEQLG